MYYHGTISNAAGSFKDLLDTILPQNQYWHIEDADAGTNIGVYHNLDTIANVDYILVVRNNQADFATLELWDGWNSATNTGTGSSLTVQPGSSNTFRINHPSGPYGLCLSDHRFIFCSLIDWAAHYIGQLLRCDPTKNMPCMITYTSAAQSTNPLGNFNHSNNTAWVTLRDEANTLRTPLSPYAVNTSALRIITTKNECILAPHSVFGTSSNRILGWLDGVCYLSGTTNGLLNGDIIFVGDKQWIFLNRNNACCLIRQD